MCCSYIFNEAQNSSTYNSLTIGKAHFSYASEHVDQSILGVLASELADGLAAPTHRLALYVGHDSTLVRLLAVLGAIPLRWPSFGSEVVFEVCARNTVFVLLASCLMHPHRFGRIRPRGSYAYFTRAQFSEEWNGCSWTSLSKS